MSANCFISRPYFIWTNARPLSRQIAYKILIISFSGKIRICTIARFERARLLWDYIKISVEMWWYPRWGT